MPVSLIPRLALLAAMLWLACGCASFPQPPIAVLPPDQPAAVLNGEGWWRVRFRMPRTGGTTHWERDLLIAHRILAPRISAHEDDIDLWRFHRRSAGDDTGHQFSLLFFASAQTADKINRQVGEDPLVAQLLADGVVAEVLTDAVDHNDRPAVSDTSDASWTPVMQRSWPHYIMGVSRMWLAMIDELSRETGIAGNADSAQLLDHYQTVNQRLTYVWQHEGQHALLHHLNAIFGYEAMILRETRWLSF